MDTLNMSCLITSNPIKKLTDEYIPGLREIEAVLRVKYRARFTIYCFACVEDCSFER